MYLTTVLLLAVVPYALCGGPVQKASIKGSTDVSAKSDKSDTFDGKIVNSGDVKGNFQGKDGWIKNTKGDVEGTQANGGEKFEGIGPGGAKDKQTGTIDKKKNIVNAVSNKGDKIIADTSDPQNVQTSVNGKESYSITRDKNGNAEVFSNSKKSSYQLKNLKEKTDNVRVEVPGKPELVARQKDIKDSKGGIKESRTSLAENTIPGIDVGNKNDARMLYQGSSDSDLIVGQSVGATNNDNLAIGAGASVSSGASETKPCLTNADGTDYFGKSGFSIDDKSTKFELIKNSAGEYEFPSCFNMFASVFIPAGVDPAQVAAHARIRSLVAGGEMQCDTKVACLDKTTANRPAGSCFFCDFCSKSQPQGAFGLGSESNFCDAKAAKSLPLKWKVCPPEGGGGKFIPFLPTGEKSEGDIVSQVSIYLRKDKKWVQVACKQEVHPFRAGLAKGPSVGTKKVSSAAGSATGGSTDLSKIFSGRRK